MANQNEFAYYEPLARVLLKALNYDIAIISFQSKIISNFLGRHVEVDVMLYRSEDKKILSIEVKSRRDKVLEGFTKAILNSIFSNETYIALAGEALSLLDLVIQLSHKISFVGIIKIEKEDYRTLKEFTEKDKDLKNFVFGKLIYNAPRSSEPYNVLHEQVIKEIFAKYDRLKERGQIIER